MMYIYVYEGNKRLGLLKVEERVEITESLKRECIKALGVKPKGKVTLFGLIKGGKK